MDHVLAWYVRARWLLAALLCSIVMLVGCDAEYERQYDATDFEETSEELAYFYGNPLEGLKPCKLLRPLVQGNKNPLRLGFFMGGQGGVKLGPLGQPKGFDVVLDLFHQEMTASKYASKAIFLKPLDVGPSVTGYVGIAAGFKNGVQDWYGHFASSSISGSLPILADYLSVGATTFASAVDRNDDGLIGPDEVVFPKGVYGGSVGVSASLDFIPDPIPGNLSVSQGLWTPYPKLLQQVHAFVKKRKVFGLFPLRARPVDFATGERCTAPFGKRCVVRFGKPGTSRFQRAKHVAAALCEMTGGCQQPGSWKLAMTALAIGLARDRGGFRAMCGG